MAEVEAGSLDGIPVKVLAFLGVLMGEPEVAESCDGEKCHSGKGA